MPGVTVMQQYVSNMLHNLPKFQQKGSVALTINCSEIFVDTKIHF